MALTPIRKHEVARVPTVISTGPRSWYASRRDVKEPFKMDTLQNDNANSELKSQLRCSSCLYPKIASCSCVSLDPGQDGGWREDEGWEGRRNDIVGTRSDPKDTPGSRNNLSRFLVVCPSWVVSV
jgi:hypothetical protein